MGYFRRFRLESYTADECREKCDKLEARMCGPIPNKRRARAILEEWACYRELLARHEKENESPLDNK